MRLHRFFVGESIGISTSYLVKDQVLIKQWRNVFRYTTGSRVLLFDGTGAEYLALMQSITPDRAEFQILQKVATKDENQIKKKSICLMPSLIKNNNFDLVLQKAVELGVDKIVPVISDRTVKNDLNMVRSRRIVTEAAEQSGRSFVPTIEELQKLRDSLDDFDGTVIVCVAGGQSWKKVWTKKLQEQEGDIGFLIGPEGGWTTEELALFKEKKYVHLGLGEQTLRAETAAIAVLSLVSIA